MAAKIKVIELAKELGVTSKDLMLAAEEMGHKGVRAMTPLDSTLANALRVKLGRGRELPPEEPKSKRAPRTRAVKTEGGGEGDAPARPARTRKAKPGQPEEAPATVELRPAATIVKPRPAEKPADATETPEPLVPAAES